LEELSSIAGKLQKRSMLPISVVIPTLNRANYLRRSLLSVINQEGVDFEIIIVDDFSHDDSYDRVSDLLDDRIRYVRLEASVGAAQARNLGVAQARGKYLAFQDSDDVWLPGKLIAQFQALEAGKPNEVLNFCSHRRVSGTEQVIIPSKASQLMTEHVFEELLKENFISTQTMMVKKSIFEEVGGFDPKLPRYQDWDIALRISSKYSVQFLPETFAIVYDTPGNLTSRTDNHMESKFSVISKWRNDPRFCKPLFAFHLYFLASEAFDKGLFLRAREMALESAMLSPQKARSWFLFAKSSIFFLLNLKRKRERFP